MANKIKNTENHLQFQTLEVQGTKYKTLLTKKYENRKKWEQPNDKQILSYIPGTIKELFVKQGDKIGRNEPLLLLEAMKMENLIFAPFSGILKSVNVSINDRVPKGTIMIEFE